MPVPSYKQVIECVRRETGRTVKTCWIAEVKRELGLPTREAWNRGKGKGSPPCPADLKQEIERCLNTEEARRAQTVDN